MEITIVIVDQCTAQVCKDNLCNKISVTFVCE